MILTLQADGSAIVRLGQTSVVCGVRAEVAPPGGGGAPRVLAGGTSDPLPA